MLIASGDIFQWWLMICDRKVWLTNDRQQVVAITIHNNHDLTILRKFMDQYLVSFYFDAKVCCFFANGFHILALSFETLKFFGLIIKSLCIEILLSWNTIIGSC